jgi:AcrR family transcriptional regulator
MYDCLMADQQASGTLWDKARVAVQAQVVDVAFDLFLANGFDAVTIDQIVTASGISKRSFFRYFGTKEDLVLGDIDAQGTLLAAAVADRPAEEDPWTALERAARSLPSSSLPDERAFAIARLMVTTPSLRARHAQKRAEWHCALVPVVQSRLSDSDPDSAVKAIAIVATVLACLDAATEVWVGNDGEGSLDVLYNVAIATVRGRSA